MIIRFRRSFVLVVPALALALAGALQGQVVCPSPVQPANPAGNLLRVEGTTEEVADVNIYCAAGSTLGLGTVRAALNAQVTSPARGAATDAALLITPTDGALPTRLPHRPTCRVFRLHSSYGYRPCGESGHPDSITFLFPRELSAFPSGTCG